MPFRNPLIARAGALLLLAGLLSGCRAKPAPVAAPAPARTDLKVAEFLAQGDDYFSQSHLYAWRQAESLYRQAFELQKTERIKERLLLTRFLIMTRQMDEDIFDPHQDETVKELCSNPVSGKDRLLCSLAELYRRGIWLPPPQGEPARKIRIDRASLETDHSPLDAYLVALCARADALEDSPEKPDVPSDLYKDSPLFAYLEFPKRGVQKLAEMEKALPQFAELHDFLGQYYFQRQKYNGSKANFKKAVELIPDYTRSLNGLGNIYTYVLEDYDKALEYYATALKYDPRNTAALFGRGLALHHLGKFEESNAAIDAVFLTDIYRKGYASATNVNYYQGEGYYLQAFNHYLMKNPVRARELVDRAKKFLPESEEVNYLSGLLFFEQKDMEAARLDFLKVTQRHGSNCSALRYLGMIYRERKGVIDSDPVPVLRVPPSMQPQLERFKKFAEGLSPSKDPGEKRALHYFLRSCSCVEGAARALEDQVKGVPALDLDEDEKVVLKGKLDKKLFDFRLASDSMIQSMIDMVSRDNVEGGQTYAALMTEILTRLRLSVSGKE